MLRNLIAHSLRSLARLSDQSLPAGKIRGILERYDVPVGKYWEQSLELEKGWQGNAPALPDCSALARTGLPKDAGLLLDWHLMNNAQTDRPALLQIAEQLLRHVEVKRKASLSPGQVCSQSDRWRQKLAVAIFFCHLALKQKDLRFLNAALKLNDWAFPFFRSRLGTPRAAVFIASLQCQEQALQELLK